MRRSEVSNRSSGSIRTWTRRCAWQPGSPDRDGPQHAAWHRIVHFYPLFFTFFASCGGESPDDDVNTQHIDSGGAWIPVAESVAENERRSSLRQVNRSRRVKEAPPEVPTRTWTLRPHLESLIQSRSAPPPPVSQPANPNPLPGRPNLQYPGTAPHGPQLTTALSGAARPQVSERLPITQTTSSRSLSSFAAASATLISHTPTRSNFSSPECVCAAFLIQYNCVQCTRFWCIIPGF